MRVNVYSEEFKYECALTVKKADTGNEFVGLRFFLDSPIALHHTENDDDRSAVTFWVQGSKYRGYEIDKMILCLQEGIDLLRNKRLEVLDQKRGEK